MCECYSIVFFDLEATGPLKEDQIVQIAAKSGHESFSAYILPTCEIHPGVSAATGLNLIGNYLLFNSVVVPTTSSANAMREFIVFLQSFGSKVILVAHGGSTFDFPKVLQLARKLNMMYDFSSAVYGFVDTLPLLRSKLEYRVIQNGKFSLEALAEDYLGSYNTRTAHDALMDATVLEKIICCDQIYLSRNEILSSAVTIQEFQYSYHGHHI